MVAYNLRKVENRDRYPDPPVGSRYSIVAVPRLVAPVAPVRFRVAAVTFLVDKIFSSLTKTFGPVLDFGPDSRLHSSVGRACA